MGKLRCKPRHIGIAVEDHAQTEHSGLMPDKRRKAGERIKGNLNGGFVKIVQHTGGVGAHIILKIKSDGTGDPVHVQIGHGFL